VTQQTATQHKLPNSLKAALLIVAATFLAYSIYWMIQGIIWGYTVTNMLLNINQISLLTPMGPAEMAALFVQEYCSVANSFVLLFCGVFAFQSAVLYVRTKEKYLGKLRWALVLLAVFQLLLLPSSLHHLLGVALDWFMVDVFVGLSYLVQALLIVPPLLVLSQKMRNPQNTAPIKKWAFITAPLFVFALYFKYLFLWLDTLLPLGPSEATVATLGGAANCLVTLLVAGVVTAAACYTFNRGKNFGNPLAGAVLVLVGVFFIIYTVVAFFVPVYASFWYLTDFWMLSLPVLGIELLSHRKTNCQ
jgi:hypothetical protein